MTFNTTLDLDIQGLESDLVKRVKSVTLVSSSTHDGIASVVFNIARLSNKAHDDVVETLKKIDPEARIDVFYPSNQFGGY